MKKIDFVFDDAVVKQLVLNMNKPACEVSRILWPIEYLYRMHCYLSLILNKKLAPADYDKLKIFQWEIVADIQVYHLIEAIMLNNVRTVKMILSSGEIELNRNLSKTAVAWRLDAGNWWQLYNYTFLSMAAILGRKEIFKLLIEKGADPGILIWMSGMNPGPIDLSINECFIMNAMYHLHKRGKKKILKTSEANVLIDCIILASQKSPLIVSDDRLADPIIRIALYWYALKEMVEDQSLLLRLIPLNHHAMKDILGIK